MKLSSIEIPRVLQYFEYVISAGVCTNALRTCVVIVSARIVILYKALGVISVLTAAEVVE